MAKKLTTVDVLRKARELVSKGWCRGTYATNKDGDCVQETAKDACYWCASGAMLAAADGGRVYWVVRGVMRDVVGGSIPRWNDNPGRTQADVVAAFDKAIELAEKEAA